MSLLVAEGGELDAKPSLPTPIDLILLTQTFLTRLTPSKPRMINSTEGRNIEIHLTDRGGRLNVVWTAFRRWRVGCIARCVFTQVRKSSLSSASSGDTETEA
jgi:hypothetical protein